MIPKIKVNGEWQSIAVIKGDTGADGNAAIEVSTTEPSNTGCKLWINPEEDFTSIKQTTGQSTTDVMSQKAVTDALSGGNYQLINTINSDDVTGRRIELLDSCSGYKDIIVRRETDTAVSKNVYLSLLPEGAGSTGTGTSLALTLLNSTKRTIWIIHFDPVITITEQYSYNYTDSLRCDTSKGICTAFGVTNLNQMLALIFYNDTQVPAGETYYVYAK